MSFFEKVRSKESGILLYGITPPKAHTAPEKVREIAEKSLGVLRSMDVDAIVVYDLQDESERTAEERPFPFAYALDPFEYVSNYMGSVALPKIIYRPAGKFTKEELNRWLHELKKHSCYPLFVGLASPDSVVKTSLAEAYQVFREHHKDHSVIGAVTIPERHAVLKDEDVRMLDKLGCGVSYFISQCIFNVDYAKNVLDALVEGCRKNNQQIPTVIFTLTLCGSIKTLQFLEWLGIHIPEEMKKELGASEHPLQRSGEIATAIATELLLHCKAHKIPFGFNIESVSVRKEEVEASLALLNGVRELMKEHGVRKEPNRQLAS